eukprot:1194029-Prorocentrum_minimum.AAC.1
MFWLLQEFAVLLLLYQPVNKLINGKPTTLGHSIHAQSFEFALYAARVFPRLDDRLNRGHKRGQPPHPAHAGRPINFGAKGANQALIHAGGHDIRRLANRDHIVWGGRRREEAGTSGVTLNRPERGLFTPSERDEQLMSNRSCSLKMCKRRFHVYVRWAGAPWPCPEI